MAIAATPTNLYVTQSNGQVYLTWDLMSGATSYQIQRSTDGVAFSNLTAPAVNYYTDTTVSTATRYWYQVASVNGSGTSSYTSAQLVIPALAGQMSLYEIRKTAQQRADRVNSNFVTQPEWNTYINQSAFELYDLLVTLYEDYFVAPVARFVTSGTTNLYALPDGVTSFTGADGNSFVARPFYKMLGVDCGLQGGVNANVSLKKFEFIARNRYVYPNITSTFLGVFNMQYRIMGSNLQIIPTPGSGQTISLWYIPRLTQLLADTDMLDGVSGWTEYVIVDAAIKALNKEESDVSALMAEKAQLMKRIEESGMNRDAGQPDTISATRTWSERWGGYGGPGYDGNYGGY